MGVSPRTATNPDDQPRSGVLSLAAQDGRPKSPFLGSSIHLQKHAVRIRYDAHVHPISAFVLAGGRSSRLGRDKALLPFCDRNFLQIALDNARAVCPDPLIVGARSLYASYGPVIEDVLPGCGPLSGIHAALSTTKSELSLVLSVDMPLMTPEFLRWLLDIAFACSDLAVVPEANGRTQPLCTVFRRSALGEVEQALRAGAFKVDRLFSILPTRFVSENEWRAAGLSPDIFRNVNTPEEYESVVATLEPPSPVSIRGPQS